MTTPARPSYAGHRFPAEVHRPRRSPRKPFKRQVRLTTELHRGQEAEPIRLARRAAADRSHALTPQEVRAGIARSGVVHEGEHGDARRRAVETLAADDGLAVPVGVAGAGKTKGVLPSLVEAWKARGLEVWGTGQRWETARELEGGGIERFCRPG